MHPEPLPWRRKVPVATREMPRFSPGGLIQIQKSLRKFMSLAIMSRGITLAPVTPCKMPVGEEAAMGSAESHLDMQTA